MDYRKRKPDFMIEVVRPSYESGAVQIPGIKTINVYGPYKHEIVAQFLSSPTKIYDEKKSTACVSYNFRESLETVGDGFSLELTLEQDGEGRTWCDKLKVMDLVFISEFGEVRFCGYIKDKRYSASMAGGKPNRRIMISGGSLGELLSSFKLIIDQYLYQGDDTAYTASKKLMAMLSQQMEEGGKFSNILTTIYDAFFDLVLKMGQVNAMGAGIRNILNYHIDYESELSDETVVKYPMNISLYQVGENSIWDIWVGLVVPPINELFGRWSPDENKYKLVFRRSPFDASDWKALKKNIIPSIIVSECDVGNSVNEVFTYYLGSLPGSGISKQKSMVLFQEGYGHAGIIDKEKWKMYGYRPLIVEYKYFNKSQIENFESAVQLMNKLSTELKNWYTNNDRFLSGSVELMTVNKDEWQGKLENPRIGERIGFLGGEFYVEEAEHSWNFIGPMKTRLRITRGYRYSGMGEMQGEIEDLGMKVKEIIKEVS
jgi:hypothetical protein